MAAPYFFISFKDPFVENPNEGTPTETLVMDSTSSIARVAPSSVTKNLIETGAEVADHYFVKSQSVSFSGTITDIKSPNPNNSRSTSDYLTILQKLREVGRAFTIVCGDASVDSAGALGGFNVLENCLFDNFVVVQNEKKGITTSADLVNKSYRVSFSATQLRFATEAEVSEIKVPAELIKKETQTKQEVDNNTLSKHPDSSDILRGSAGGYQSIMKEIEGGGGGESSTGSGGISPT